ncbi:PREDICTED: uncharacterized protein LOC105128662 [Populus euphratica]|uniref:Uncharacterized protein LOC105128662 n=1 Tax=Populus euphratica TaxID=75702 RepID=A0AAJ6UF43_POPEU|nr:PREDICTED: uncharacterized protein LOC105128662 [Populus euphratica]
MVSREYHIWKWYVFLINDKLFSDQFMHHLWIMVLEIQKMDIFAYKVAIVEGNYLLLEDGAWKDVSSMFDEKWFIDVDIDTERHIVLKRHILQGKPPDVSKWQIGQRAA